ANNLSTSKDLTALKTRTGKQLVIHINFDITDKTMNHTELPSEIITTLHKGVVIPALPLALNKHCQLDEHRQRALMRYYLDAGAGGVAVGVHTTQFEIRLPEFNLYKPVLEIAREEFDRFETEHKKPVIRIAGVIG